MSRFAPNLGSRFYYTQDIHYSLSVQFGDFSSWKESSYPSSARIRRLLSPDKKTKTKTEELLSLLQAARSKSGFNRSLK
uniref:Uncharacterized protein n=1 Tax=Salix viminalis TaxID=40686 RepID=A0A6N2L3V0_SALVM